MDNKKQNIKYSFSLVIFAFLAFVLFIGPSQPLGREFSRWFMYWNSEKANDNSQNWACHNYAHNLMRTAEPNSIFMTEGGDNQVFSLLYFSYVERKRPDVDFFDQKGNVFPRLYGDLMNVHPIDLEIIRDLRDFQLYSTGRPVYLTWKRPNLHRLKADYFPEKLKEIKQRYPRFSQYIDSKWKLDNLEQIEYAVENMVPVETFNKRMKVGDNLKKQHLKYLGPWYFKQYGILFKVTPIKYAIVDALDLYQQADIAKIIPFVRRVSEIELTAKEVRDYARELIREGYISQKGNTYKLVKALPSPYHESDLDAYWNNYTMDYTNVFNARYWDYLTREIFDNYNFQRGNYCLARHNLLKETTTYLIDKTKKSQYSQKANEYVEEANIWFEQGCFYGPDMPGRFFNYANILMQLGRQEKAIEYYQKTGEMEKDMYLPFLNIGVYYLNQSQSVPLAGEVDMLNKALDNFKEAKFRMELNANKQNRDVAKDSAFAGEYASLNNFIRKIEACLETSRVVVEEKKKQAESGQEKDLEELAEVYIKRFDFDKAVAIYDRMIKKKPNEYSLVVKKYNVAKQFNIILSIQILEDAFERFEQLKGVNPGEKFQIAKICGEFYISYGENLITRPNADANILNQAEQCFIKANDYLSFYRNWGMGLLGHLKNQGEVAQANQLRRDLVQVEKNLKHVVGRLQLIENVKKQQGQI